MKVSSKTDEVKISEEHDDYKWFTKEELKEVIDKGLLSKAAMNSFKEVKLGGNL